MMKVKVKVTQSCPTLCDLMDYTVHGILQAKILEWFSSVQFSHPVVSDSLRPHGPQHARTPCPSPTPGACSNSCPSCPTLYNPLGCSPPGSSVHGISRQEYWNGLPFPLPGDLPDPGTELSSLCTDHMAHHALIRWLD